MVDEPGSDDTKVLTPHSSCDGVPHRLADAGALSPSREGVDSVGLNPTLNFVALEPD